MPSEVERRTGNREWLLRLRCEAGGSSPGRRTSRSPSPDEVGAEILLASVCGTMQGQRLAMSASAISSRARSHLRSLAHALKPVVQVGGDGLTEMITKATNVALTEHELIKVKLGQGFVGERKQAARELADATEADLTQLIGKTIVLYRPRPADHPKNKDKPRISLPD